MSERLIFWIMFGLDLSVPVWQGILVFVLLIDLIFWQKLAQKKSRL
ncbi:MAG: hypothetical protein SO161_04045 [Treponema sp.]|nr:hypothetical protein [Treponema sp.]